MKPNLEAAWALAENNFFGIPKVNFQKICPEEDLPEILDWLEDSMVSCSVQYSGFKVHDHIYYWVTVHLYDDEDITAFKLRWS